MCAYTPIHSSSRMHVGDVPCLWRFIEVPTYTYMCARGRMLVASASPRQFICGERAVIMPLYTYTEGCGGFARRYELCRRLYKYVVASYGSACASRVTMRSHRPIYVYDHDGACVRRAPAPTHVHISINTRTQPTHTVGACLVCDANTRGAIAHA